MVETTMKETAELPIEGMSCQSCVERIYTTLAKMPGIEHLQVELGKVRLEYYPQAISLIAIQELLRSLGYSIAGATPERNPFKRFLNRMIENNEKQFGSQPPSCCTMKKK